MNTWWNFARSLLQPASGMNFEHGIRQFNSEQGVESPRRPIMEFRDMVILLGRVGKLDRTYSRRKEVGELI